MSKLEDFYREEWLVFHKVISKLLDWYMYNDFKKMSFEKFKEIYDKNARKK